MSPNLFLALGIVCAVVAVAGGVWWWMSIRAAPFSDIRAVIVQFPQGIIHAEVAASPLKHAAGLSARSSLAPDSGMLFVFATPQEPAFWMKGMRFPLDFVWLRNNTVVSLNENVSIPKNMFDFNIIQPNQSVDMVLEVNVGTIQKLGIHEGDRVEIQKDNF